MGKKDRMKTQGRGRVGEVEDDRVLRELVRLKNKEWAKGKW